MSVEDPKRFDKSADIVVLDVDHGIRSLVQFQNDVKKIEELEVLKRRGLDDDEIVLYRQHENGELVSHRNMESTVLQQKLQSIYKKIKNSEQDGPITDKDQGCKETESTAREVEQKSYVHHEHPMNNIKELENDMFGHISFDKIESLTKRRKLLRRLKRKENTSLLSDNFPTEGQSEIASTSCKTQAENKKSLWDIKEISKPSNPPIQTTSNYISQKTENKKLIGPKLQTIYTVKNNKIVRLEPMLGSDSKSKTQEYRAVDIKVPINKGEERLLEGSQLGVDDIRNIPKFKEYERGLPTKVLFIKNISPHVCEADLLSILNKFAAENGAAIDIRILSGRMRGQAFVHFTSEAVCVKALEATNGVILKGKPIIVQFGKSQGEKKY